MFTKKFHASYSTPLFALVWLFLHCHLGFCLDRLSAIEQKILGSNVGTSLNFQLSILYQRNVCCYVVSFDLHYPCSLTFAQSIQTVKVDHAAFLSRLFNSKRNSNAPHYQLLKYESFLDESSGVYILVENGYFPPPLDIYIFPP